MMPLELIQLVADTTTSAAGGDVCLPWWALIGVATPMAGAIVYQTRRIVLLTDRSEQRLDALLEKARLASDAVRAEKNG